MTDRTTTETDVQPDPETEHDDQETAEAEPETFPLAYVQKLRQESADARVKVKDRDTLAERLHVAQVAALGRLADPTDLPYAEGLLDPDALATAMDELLARKPHLASRRPAGDIGQGASTVTDTVDLAGLLRARA